MHHRAELPRERLDDVFMVPAGLIERQARGGREHPAEVQGSASQRRADSGKRPLVAGSMTRQEEQAFNAAVLGTFSKKNLLPCMV